jgi:heat-inducible transcriptional repressor
MFGTLDDREAEVLRHIVNAFIQENAAVGSRTISQMMSNPVSAATVRNVMADLQERGLIDSPHTSAGRIPTNDGLRLYIHSYMERHDLSPDERRVIEEQCQDHGRSPKEIFEQTSRILSGMSSSIGMVVVPKNDSPIRHIEFKEIEPGRAIVIIVQENGHIENRLIDMPQGVSAGDMQAASNYLKSKVFGRTIGEIKEVIEESMSAAKKELDDLTAKVVESGAAIRVHNDADILIVQGASNMLAQSSVSQEDLEEIQRLFNLLEDQAIASKLLQEARKGEGVQIYIGSDNQVVKSRQFSMILSPALNADNKIVGVTGVIGPRRLNYRRIVPVVDYTSQVMSRLISPK